MKCLDAVKVSKRKPISTGQGKEMGFVSLVTWVQRQLCLIAWGWYIFAVSLSSGF